MTYIVYDGKTLIADKLMSQGVGSYALGRKPRTAGGFVVNRPGKKVDVYYNDTEKVIFLRKGLYEGKEIKCLAMAGQIVNLGELISYLEQGHDLDHYLDCEAAVYPVKERRNFGPGNSITVVMKDGAGYNFHHVSDGIDRVMSSKGLIHGGAGVSWVNGINPHLSTPLTALEAFVIGSHYSSVVSEEFDYYCSVTNEYKKNQKLSMRQRESILARVQSRFALNGEVANENYVNLPFTNIIKKAD
ncbi:hypothetical protein MZD04_gp390 [Pseudomonas phage Psa21]|uniref:Uncharacterized protein n=1 Tax=Pseudomonas phage Psa21 TaxID=2530023 RepID=A0A481W4Z4_9CAUD|nr:hypothetical protein MZD04_gp390 [Pseudomonas phage Psa21]QBJ02916.1 hypothetical protein PSA21_390 [Pseudomonas phage Psa21]